MISDFENIEGSFHGYTLSNEEKDILDQLKEGEVDAFEKIYEKYSPVLFKYGQAFTTDLQTLEDSLQDFFIALWNKRRQIDIRYSLLFYFIKSYRRVVLGKLKEKRGNQVRLVNYVGSLSLEEDTNEEFQFPDSLREAIKTLPNQQYEVIMLKYIYGHSHEMIAEIMGITVESSNNLSSRALTSLRKFFSKSTPKSSLENRKNYL